MKFVDVIDAIGKGISDAVDYVADKNKTNAQLNRIKTVIKHETETLNKCYATLGKYYYENMRDIATDENKKACELIESSIKNIDIAKEKYFNIISSQNTVKAGTEISGDIITSNNVNPEKNDELICECACENNCSSDAEDCEEADVEEERLEKTRKTLKMVIKKAESKPVVDDVTTDEEVEE